MKLVLALLGPTGSGKTTLAETLAPVLGAELCNLDATATYQNFDIGSAKPSSEAQERTPYHLLDIWDPNHEGDAFDYCEKASGVIDSLTQRGVLPFFVGGSYFYLRGLENGFSQAPAVSECEIQALVDEVGGDYEEIYQRLSEWDEDFKAKVHAHDHYRVARRYALWKLHGLKTADLSVPPKKASSKRHWFKYAMVPSRKLLHENIRLRTKKMLARGWVEETQKILQLYPHAKALQSVGYFEIQQMLLGQLRPDELEEAIFVKTCQLAKRQVTWLRSDPEIRYIDPMDKKRVVLEVGNIQSILETSSCNQ